MNCGCLGLLPRPALAGRGWGEGLFPRRR
jgi:hypothetical protein